MTRSRLWLSLSVGLVSFVLSAAGDDASPSIENNVLRITLNSSEASLTVTDRRNGLVWRQMVTPGFSAAKATIKQSSTSISLEVSGKGGPYLFTIGFAADRPHGFDLTLDI